MTEEAINYYYVISAFVVWAGSLTYFMNSSKYEKMRKDTDDKVMIHLMSIGLGVVGFLWPFALAYYFASKLVINIGKIFIRKKEEN